MNNYEVGKQITDFFAVRKSSIGTARNESKYLDLRLSDGKQELLAKQWDYAEDMPLENTVIKAQAIVGNYQGKIQLTIRKWWQVEPWECDPSKFLPVCLWSKEDLLKDYFDLVAIVKDDQYLNLLSEFASCPTFESFTIAPGAKDIHHAYLHGLLEHSVDVAKKAIALSDSTTNKDLLITGALIHDIGKIDEYDWSGCVITRTTTGKLIGHIALGLMMIDDWQKETRNHEKHLSLCHLIASHHGKLEFGSPVEPQTKEAVILHTADMMDFQVNVIDKAIAEAAPGSEWTSKTPGIRREFFIGRTVVGLDEAISAPGDALPSQNEIKNKVISCQPPYGSL